MCARCWIVALRSNSTLADDPKVDCASVLFRRSISKSLALRIVLF